MFFKGCFSRVKSWPPCLQLHSDLDGKRATPGGKHQVRSHGFLLTTLLWRNWHLLERIMLFRAHNPVPGSDRVVVDFDLIYLGDADIQVEGNHEVCQEVELNPGVTAWSCSWSSRRAS